MSPRILCIATCLTLIPSLALAGGGPETTLVVVNGDSPVSRLVANEYVRMREIPPENVLHIKGIPHLGVVDLAFFKERIWGPIARFLDEQGIADQIDLIAYSADFPYAVSFKPGKQTGQSGQVIGGQASLSGLTYLIRHVLAGDEFWDLSLNRYYRVGPRRGARPLRAATDQERKLAAAAQQALGRKNHAEAAEAFGKLLSSYPWIPDGWYNFACCLARLGRTDDAFKALAGAAKAGFSGGAHAERDPDLESLRKDPRFPEAIRRILANAAQFLPAHGHRSSYAWTGAPEPDRGAADSKRRYYLSTHLAYTGFQGNSVPEILAYLRSAVSTDGTTPAGTVYLCKNANVRSTTRAPYFPAVTSRLKALDRKVELLESGEGQTGVLPMGKKDVIGAVVGTAGFKWEKSNSRILPGAIVEHLTSFGAHFGTGSQTKCTEFLRHGAAGTSGTVREPLALHQKFPNPMIHAFYAEGCSLAEAFYQSVWGPYQLMILGDGLARPFAEFAKIAVDIPDAPWTGTITLLPRAPGCTFELWVDGRPVAKGEKLVFDTKRVADGHHDVRVVAVAEDRIETRTTKRFPVVVENGNPPVGVKYLGEQSLPFGAPLAFRSPGSSQIAIYAGTRLLAEGKGNVAIEGGTFGPGPVTLTPVVRQGGTELRCEPVAIDVVAPDLASPPKAPEHPRKPGLGGNAYLRSGEQPVAVLSIGDRSSGNPVTGKKLDAISRLVLEGEIEIPTDGFHQFLVTGAGRVTLTVGGKKCLENHDLRTAGFVPLWLSKGWFPIRIDLEPKGRANVALMLGGDSVLRTPNVRHSTFPALAREPEIEGAEAGKPVEVGEDGVVLKWSRPIADVAAVTLTPAKGLEAFPKSWIVEVPAGRNKWKRVKDLVLVSADRSKGAPAFVEVSFHPVRTKSLRIRPEDGEKTQLSGVTALRKR